MGNGHPKHVQGILSPSDLVGIRGQWVFWLPTLAINACLSFLQLLQPCSPVPFLGLLGFTAQTQPGRREGRQPTEVV